MPDAPATVNEEKARKFCAAYQSCVETPMIYTHVLNRPGVAPVKGPLDQ